MVLNWWLRLTPMRRVRTRRQFRRQRLTLLLHIEQLEDRTLLNAGALDPTFGTAGFVHTSINTDANITSVVVQPDGKIVAGGISSLNNFTVFTLARYNANGSLDSTFGSGGKVSMPFGQFNAELSGLALQNDGKIVAAGTMGIQFGVARYNTDGSLDANFGSNGVASTLVFSADRVGGLVIAHDNNIIVAGTADGHVTLVAFTPMGTLSPNFGNSGVAISESPPFAASVGGVALQSDGRIVVVGTEIDSIGSFTLTMRLTAVGAPDATFSGFAPSSFIGRSNVSKGVVIQPNKLIDVVVDVGYGAPMKGYTPPTLAHYFATARYMTDRSPDYSFGTIGQTVVTSLPAVPTGIALQADGKIVMSGTSWPLSVPTFAVTERFNANGTRDSTFGIGGIFQFPSEQFSAANAIAMQQDGKIVIVGNARTPAGSTFTLARITTVNSVSEVTVTGADAGGGPNVVVVDLSTNTTKMSFFAYDPAFTGGVRVAMGDLNGDGVKELITGPGPGGGPDIHVYDLRTGQLLTQFFAFNPAFTGGVYVATGDVNGDGRADIIVSADAGAGPNVAVYDGRDQSLLFSFFAFAAGFTGGVRVAAGDVNQDGRADIITGAGPGGGPNVLIFNPATLQPISSFFAFSQGFNGGIYVAAGDVNGDGKAEVIVGAGPGAGPNVAVFDAIGRALLSFFPYDRGFTGGVRVAAANSIMTAPGPGGGPDARIFDGRDAQQIDQFFAYSSLFSGGLYVAAGI